MKIRQVGGRVVPREQTGRQTDRHDAALSRFSQFGERASKRVENKMPFTAARNRVGIRTTYAPHTNLQLIATIKHQLRTLLLGVPQLISVMSYI